MAVWLRVIGQKGSTYKAAKKLISEIDEMINIVRGWAGNCSNRFGRIYDKYWNDVSIKDHERGSS